MANVVIFKPRNVHEKINAEVLASIQKKADLKIALKKIQNQNGLDYGKLLFGDQHEINKRNLMQYQEHMEEM